RCDVLAAGGHDDLLLPTADRQIPIVVEGAEVAGAEPTVVELLGRGLVVVPVLPEDRHALGQDLPVGCDGHRDSRQRHADGADLGAMFLPLEVTMISFFRPLIVRYPSSSREPRSPVPNQPSWNSLAVASSLFQYSRKIGTPLARISPSGAMATETPGSGTPTVP